MVDMSTTSSPRLAPALTSPGVHATTHAAATHAAMIRCSPSLEPPLRLCVIVCERAVCGCGCGTAQHNTSTQHTSRSAATRADTVSHRCPAHPPKPTRRPPPGASKLAAMWRDPREHSLRHGSYGQSIKRAAISTAHARNRIRLHLALCRDRQSLLPVRGRVCARARAQLGAAEHDTCVARLGHGACSMPSSASATTTVPVITTNTDRGASHWT